MNHNLSPNYNVLAKYLPNYEYRSQTEIFGLPMIHITQGIDPQTGRFRVACGWFALGDIAIGGIAVGGITFGILSFGGISLGALVVGGIAIGGFALGGIAIGAAAAVGAIAVSLKLALGSLTYMLPHNLVKSIIPQFLRTLVSWFTYRS